MSSYIRVMDCFKYCHWLLLLMGLFSACTKTETEVVPGNMAPPDTTISNQLYDDYINRTYILVLGREPDSLEFQSANSVLRSAGFSLPSRKQFLDSLFADADYRHRQFSRWKGDLLNSMDTADVTIQIFLIDFQLGDTTFQAFWPILQVERNRLVELQQAGTLYVQGVINLAELQRRMLNNYFYDQINMGSLNFVVASFQQLLGRNPTLSEQNNGISMVDGLNAVLLLQSGAGKDDYLDILTGSDDYFEGAVVRLYNEFLFRDPSSLEMSIAAIRYRDTGDYEQIQKEILSTDEFIGLE
jgi:hypothetical protein